MKELVFLLEEESAKAMLEGVLPRIFPDSLPVRYIVFEGKQDLEKQLTKRIRGYQNPAACFVVLRDQDSHPDCWVIKSRLIDLCRRGGCDDALVRIACRELESFYLADLLAVERGLGLSGLARFQQRTKYRNPDLLGSPSNELQELTKGLYQKVGGSRAIGSHLNITNTRSASFKNLISGIMRVAEMGGAIV